MTGRVNRALKVTATLLNDLNLGRGRAAANGKDVWRRRYLGHHGHMSGTDVESLLFLQCPM